MGAPDATGTRDARRSPAFLPRRALGRRKRRVIARATSSTMGDDDMDHEIKTDAMEQDPVAANDRDSDDDDDRRPARAARNESPARSRSRSRSRQRSRSRSRERERDTAKQVRLDPRAPSPPHPLRPAPRARVPAPVSGPDRRADRISLVSLAKTPKPKTVGDSPRASRSRARALASPDAPSPAHPSPRPLIVR